MGHVTLVIDSADVLDDLELFRLLALPDTLVREALRSAAEVLALIRGHTSGRERPPSATGGDSGSSGT
jgi:hypothetical protein